MKVLISAILLLFAGNSFCQVTETPLKYDLPEEWEFSRADESNWNKATVPGCVHTDLLNNKLIEDPFYGVNEKNIQWIGYKDWIYRTSFSIPASLLSKENIYMIFKGLDTYAEVLLNGNIILSADNMFREWKADISKILKKDGNELIIKFNNVFKQNMPEWEKAPFRLMAFPNNDQADTMLAVYSRKAQYHYGWDWGPRFVTCGIWRPVFIEAWDNFKLEDVQIIQENVSAENADITSYLEISSGKEQTADVNISVDGKIFNFPAQHLKKGSNKIKTFIKLKNPKLWWTNGLGKQPLYRFDYKVSGGGYSDQKSVTTGIRSLEVVTEKDSIGKSLYVKLNGVPVFMKGANYIPLDNFQNRVTSDRYEYIISSAAKANMNMLRLWGGGIYEEDTFYNMCDKYGILVWHDMMFACGMYPADEKFLESVKQEVTDNVRRIRNHPSIALYCGNNENEAAWYSWGWKEKYTEGQKAEYESNLRKLFYEVIPSAIHENDPGRYYQPTSPIAGMKDVPYSEGDVHYWGVWHGKDPFSKYNEKVARFVSEYGFQSYPDILSVEKFVPESEKSLHSEVMLSHQRCMADDRKDKEYGNRLIQIYMDQHYKTPKDFNSYLYVSQVLQAEGIKTAIEAHRRNMPFCMGSLYWQINDCWPVASWSSIDYYGRWKALHYFAGKAFEQIHVDPQLKENNTIDFYIISDKLELVSADLKIKLLSFTGEVILQQSIKVSIEPNASKNYFTLGLNDVNNWNKEEAFISCSLESEGAQLSENTMYFKEPKDLALSKANIIKEYEKTGEGVVLTLSADRLVKNVFLMFDDKTFFSDNYFDLLPGVKKQVLIKTEAEITELKEKLNSISLIDTY